MARKPVEGSSDRSLFAGLSGLKVVQHIMIFSLMDTNKVRRSTTLMDFKSSTANIISYLP